MYLFVLYMFFMGKYILNVCMFVLLSSEVISLLIVGEEQTIVIYGHINNNTKLKEFVLSFTHDRI